MNVSLAVPPGKPRGPWGFWATVALSFLTWLTYSIGQSILIVIGLVVASASNPGIDTAALMRNFSTNGYFLALGTILAAVICLAMTSIFVIIRNGPGLKDYLGLKPAGWRASVRWLLVLAVFLACSDGLSYLLHRPIVPEFMFKTYQTARFLPLFFFAVLFVAPIHEEILFRGFLFRGILGSRLGPAGAILLTSGAWAILHMQYDWYGITQVFATGLVLGLVRHKTGSTALTMAMHFLTNLIASGELLLAIHVFK